MDKLPLPKTHELTKEEIAFVKSLDAFAENGECEEILASNILEYIPFPNIEQFILHLASKVAHGGKITVCGIDYVEVCKMAIRQDFNVAEFNRLIFGSGSQPRESAINLNVVATLLLSNGFKIQKKRLNGYNFVVEATRV